MASNNSIEGLKNLLSAAGVGGSDQLTSITSQLQGLKSINDTLAQEQAAAVAQSTKGSSSGGGSGIGSVLGTIGGLLGSGLGIGSLVSGITGLFGGGGGQSTPALNNYVAPLPVQLNAGFSNAAGGGAFGVDSAQGGQPRAISGGGSTQASPPQITVQVQAMDSQSFLDHSQDIASAVRQAMLQTTVLNDVIRAV